jgi:FkbM family methyltransferase
MSFKSYIARDRRYQDLKFDFLIDDPATEHWYTMINFETAERLWCTSHIKPGMTVVDAGCHHGLLSLLFAKFANPGVVYSYDALPRNAEITRQNALLNQLSNIVTRPVGLGEGPGQIKVPLNSGNVLSSFEDCPVDTHPVTIQIVSLDDDLPVPRVDFLKIDVEGSELQVLRGAQKILQARPIINLELHNLYFSDRIEHMKAVFNEFDERRWIYHLMPFDYSETQIFDGPLNYELLANFETPHVFGIPRR